MLDSTQQSELFYEIVAWTKVLSNIHCFFHTSSIGTGFMSHSVIFDIILAQRLEMLQPWATTLKTLLIFSQKNAAHC